MLALLLACTATPDSQAPCADGFGRAADGNCYALAAGDTGRPADDTDSAQDSISDTETGQDSPPDTSVDSGGDTADSDSSGTDTDTGGDTGGGLSECDSPFGWIDPTGAEATVTSPNGIIFTISGSTWLCAVSCDAPWLSWDGLYQTDGVGCTAHVTALPVMLDGSTDFCLATAEPASTQTGTCTLHTAAGDVAFVVTYAK